MSFTSRRYVLRAGLGAACACAAAGVALAQGGPEPKPTPGGKYVCPPCGCSADGKEFDIQGPCPACGMPLMPKPAPEKPPS